jgi:hypothetical protein
VAPRLGRYANGRRMLKYLHVYMYVIYLHPVHDILIRCLSEISSDFNNVKSKKNTNEVFLCMYKVEIFYERLIYLGTFSATFEAKRVKKQTVISCILCINLFNRVRVHRTKGYLYRKTLPVLAVHRAEQFAAMHFEGVPHNAQYFLCKALP